LAPSAAVSGSAGRSVLGLLRVAAGDIKLAHSVFALPFAVLGSFLALRRLWTGDFPWRTFCVQLLLVIGCMVFARTWAMLINRYADRGIDAENPRTARRAIPAGRMSPAEVRMLAAFCAAGFLVLCAGFGVLQDNWWPLGLGLPVLAWIALYSYTKRFTLLCHWFLGAALAVSPLAAAIAVRPGALADTPALWLLSGMVLLWVAGFDVIYALQDLDFDRARGLRSIPAALGVRGAIWTARILHAGAFALLVLAARADPRLGEVFGVAVASVGVLLIAEHAVLSVRGRAGLEMAFFTINGVVSVLLGLAGVVDVLV
jgi:4-hydroxybenzoate polyprenyltransferase